ncbi:hypothetical protein GCM10012319_32490 [Comamonas sp. KCTC 72670]|nr:hypothetical protein GCM10012319_32490 [Comamonas sp. KCTC 72670]
MRAAGPSGGAGEADELPLLHDVTRLHHHRAEVEVLRLQPVTMRDDDVVGVLGELLATPALGAVPPRQAHRAVARGDDGRAIRHAEIPRMGVVVLVTSRVVSLAHRVDAPTCEGDAHLGHVLRGSGGRGRNCGGRSQERTKEKG